jgi:GT2 family glycosyltransferase
MTPTNDDTRKHLRNCDKETRLAKLRALGREQYLRTQLNSMVGSRSWSLTRPLRDVTRWARNFLARGEKESAERANLSNAADRAFVDPEPGDGTDERFSTGGREAWDVAGSARLAALLEGKTKLAFPYATECRISIVVVLYGKAHLGLLCIESILRNADVPYELILVDNNSMDRTGEMLEHLEGVQVIRNRENLGFGYACGQGAERARGEFLCFLNNDALLQVGSLSAVLADFREDESIGAIGGKILLADGRLQEAGSMVWSDGSAWGYGRGDDPDLPRYNFRRPVDYSSGAFLFTPRLLFSELGGFDARFFPAYYEDSDYCFKVWNRGLRVVYEPRAVIRHYESASSEIEEAVKDSIAKNQAKFFDKWREQLQRHLARAGEHIPYARIAQWERGARILYLIELDAKSTNHARGSDSVVEQLVSDGHYVTLASTSQAITELRSANPASDVEYADFTTAAHYVFRELLSQYDAVWISGQQSMRNFLLHIRDMQDPIPPIIYSLGIISPQPQTLDSAIGVSTDIAGRGSEDLLLCGAADLVFVASEADRQVLCEKGMRNVYVLSIEKVAEVAAELGRGGQRSR